MPGEESRGREILLRPDIFMPNIYVRVWLVALDLTHAKTWRKINRWFSVNQCLSNDPSSLTHSLCFPSLFPLQFQEAQVLLALADKREHERNVLFKAMEENSNFSRMAEEKLQLKMEQNEENRLAYLAAMMERLQEKVSSRGTAVILDLLRS